MLIIPNAVCENFVYGKYIAAEKIACQPSPAVKRYTAQILNTYEFPFPPVMICANTFQKPETDNRLLSTTLHHCRRFSKFECRFLEHLSVRRKISRPLQDKSKLRSARRTPFLLKKNALRCAGSTSKTAGPRSAQLPCNCCNAAIGTKTLPLALGIIEESFRYLLVYFVSESTSISVSFQFSGFSGINVYGKSLSSIGFGAKSEQSITSISSKYFKIFYKNTSYRGRFLTFGWIIC